MFLPLMKPTQQGVPGNNDGEHVGLGGIRRHFCGGTRKWRRRVLVPGPNGARFTLTGTVCPTNKNRLFAIFLGDVTLGRESPTLENSPAKTS